jgi:hypothetical protein
LAPLARLLLSLAEDGREAGGGGHTELEKKNA